MKLNDNKIDPDFDGHPEKLLKEMTPKEKLQYLSNCIELNYIARNMVKKVKTE